LILAKSPAGCFGATDRQTEVLGICKWPPAALRAGVELFELCADETDVELFGWGGGELVVGGDGREPAFRVEPPELENVPLGGSC